MLKTWAGIPTEKYQALALFLMTLFCCVLCGWVVWRWDQSNSADKERYERMQAASARETNAQAELVRVHCASESDKLRAHYASEAEKVRTEHKQLSSSFVVMGVRFSDLEKVMNAVMKKLAAPHEDDEPTVAPRPREKVIESPCNPPR